MLAPTRMRARKTPLILLVLLAPLALLSPPPHRLHEHRAMQVPHSDRTDEHLRGIAGDGTKMTIRINPMPEEGARLKQEFEAALRNELGEQRADLVMKLSEGWLDSQFSRFGQ